MIKNTKVNILQKKLQNRFQKIDDEKIKLQKAIIHFANNRDYFIY